MRSGTGHATLPASSATTGAVNSTQVNPAQDPQQFLQQHLDHTLIKLFDQNWNVRHGAALLLRAAVKQ